MEKRLSADALKAHQRLDVACLGEDLDDLDELPVLVGQPVRPPANRDEKEEKKLYR